MFHSQRAYNRNRRTEPCEMPNKESKEPFISTMRYSQQKYTECTTTKKRREESITHYATGSSGYQGFKVPLFPEWSHHSHFWKYYSTWVKFKSQKLHWYCVGFWQFCLIICKRNICVLSFPATSRAGHQLTKRSYYKLTLSLDIS